MSVEQRDLFENDHGHVADGDPPEPYVEEEDDHEPEGNPFVDPSKDYTPPADSSPPEESTDPEDSDWHEPYRGGWKDDNGMCSSACPALSEQACRGFATKFFDCQVTGYRVTPGEWPCEIRNIYEAVKRGPEK